MKIKKNVKPAPPAESTATVETKVTAPAVMGTPMESQEVLSSKDPVEEAEGSISVKLGVTLGLPNYCSVRADVGITTPASISDDPSEIYKDVREWVIERLQTEVNELVEGLQGDD